MIRKFVTIGLLASSFLLSSSASLAEEKKESDFSMNTTAFLNEGMLPVLYTCDGKDLSPQLSWTNPPDKTESFAIVVSDPDAPDKTFYHWVVFNIPKSTTELPQGAEKLPAGSVIAKNSFGKTRYNGPCPPHDTAHTYHITLYALGKQLATSSDLSPASIVEKIEKNSIGKTELTMVYSRWFSDPAKPAAS